MGNRAGGGSRGVGGYGAGRGGASQTAMAGRYENLKAAGYSPFAAWNFATNKDVKIVVDGSAGKIYKKGKGVIGSVDQYSVNYTAYKYSQKYKNPQAVKVMF